jgi:hypothetical protein
MNNCALRSCKILVTFLADVYSSLQKHSAGLTAMTERTLGAKAGHLELLKGGKKNKDAKDGEVKKGGSKKFG